MIVEQETTLIDALSQLFPESSKRTLLQWVKFGRVTVDGDAQTKGHHFLTPGQCVALTEKKQRQAYYKGIPILYQDRAMVVIDKPASLLSVATENPLEEHALSLLREYFKTAAIYPVHRLDRETSGVLLFARGKHFQEYFDTLFETHDLTRKYVAVVEGQLSTNEGTWESYLMEKENYDVVLANPTTGKLAITHYKVLRRSKKFTYLELTLETGRKHQIRVHCKEAGHLILGDKRYGSTCNPISRLCLHATFLQFRHPLSKKEMAFTSSFPTAFKKIGLYPECFKNQVMTRRLPEFEPGEADNEAAHVN